MNDKTINGDLTINGVAGVTLVDRYRVIRHLGQGGMGSVWLAEDTKLDGRKVAVKMLPSILVSNKRAYAQVKAEAHVSLRLSHTNIATVRAFEEEGGNPFLVMDYIEGQTLDDYLAEKGTLTEEDTIRLLRPIADALDYAHGQGVVHRDVKPGNVMIDKSGRPYVLDFGIAREMQETMTRVTGKLSSGTLLYMSPEQLNGAAPKPAQDVYSFSAMAYECLTGHPPFSRGQIEHQIEHVSPEPLGPQFAKCGPGVMAGLSKAPEARPESCGAVLNAETVPVKTVGADGGASESKKKIVAAISGVLALGALVGGGWWWREMAKSEGLRVKAEAQVAVVEPESASVAEENREPDEVINAVEKPKKAEDKHVVEKVDAVRIDEEDRKAELTTFLLSAKVKSMRELMNQQPDEVKDLFKAEIGAFEDDNKAGVNATEHLRYAMATNFFMSALSKASALMAVIDQRNGYLESRVNAATAKKSADQVGAKEALAVRYTNVQNLVDAAESLAKDRKFVEAAKMMGSAEQSFKSLRSDIVQVVTDLAKGHRDAERWRECLAEADKVLDWEPENADALALKNKAESSLGPRVGDVKKIVLPGGETMDLIWCPPGCFQMGSATSDNPRGDDEAQHKVKLTRGFWIGKFEVTQRQWESVMGGNPSKFKSSNRPVEQVSWEDCQMFIRKVNAAGEVTVSLPTEAQWEYACRAGATTSLPNGKTLFIVGKNNGPDLDEISWYGGNACVGYELAEGFDCAGWQEVQHSGSKGGTHPSGQKKPNDWGIYDMIGNVCEWCGDWYDKDYYTRSPSEDPKGPTSGTRRISRGGSWYGYAQDCRSAFRNRHLPNYRSFSVGFRIVCFAGVDDANDK